MLGKLDSCKTVVVMLYIHPTGDRKTKRRASSCLFGFETFLPCWSRYVLVNALHRDLVYKQQGTESYQHLAAGQHRPFHWTDVKRWAQLLVKPASVSEYFSVFDLSYPVG